MFSSEIHVVITFPILIDGDGNAEPGALDVLADAVIERVVGSVSMLGDEGIDLQSEALDAVGSSHTEVAGLSKVSLHLRIMGNRSLLRARKAQEGDYNQDNEKNRRTV